MAKRKATTKKRKLTKHNHLQKKVAKRCENPSDANKKAVKKAKEDYIKDAVNKGKSKAEANRIANKTDTCKPFKKRK